VLAGLLLLGAGAAVGLTQQRRADEIAHALLYRQTVTRMEILGRLYRDEPPPNDTMRFKPGTAVTLVDSASGWLLPGLIEDPVGPGMVSVAFVDESVRVVPESEFVALQDAPIPPLQLFAWLAPSFLSLTTGLAESADSGNPAWVVDALLWDVLLVLACASIVRTRLSARHWLFPLCVTGGTVLALLAIPGAPGNVERHRVTQTVPLLVVLASGLLSFATFSSLVPVRKVKRATSNPAADTAPAVSTRRSA
jgi:hypothetical protein